MPKVSIMLPSYNHGKYIGKALESILEQSYQDFEIVVSDDHSTDDSVEVISSYQDPRIKFHVFEKNVGATLNHEYCWSRCSGEYIALLNSDDIWECNHLENSVRYLDSHRDCGAVFSWASYIDEDGNGNGEPAVAFKQLNKNRAQWLLQFYLQGNCLCHPSMVIRKEVYDEVGFYSRSLRQLPDFEQWIRILKKYEIHVLPEIAVRFRRSNRTMENTSAPTDENSIRDIAESSYVLGTFFEGMDDELFAQVFRSMFRNPEACTHEEFVCERYFILLDDHYYIKKLSIPHAFFYFNRIYSQPGIARIFEEKYGYFLKDFHALGAQMDFLGLHDKMSGGLLTVNQNSAKYRLRALAWAVFGKDTPIYDKLVRVFRGKIH